MQNRVPLATRAHASPYACGMASGGMPSGGMASGGMGPVAEVRVAQGGNGGAPRRTVAATRPWRPDRAPQWAVGMGSHPHRHAGATGAGGTRRPHAFGDAERGRADADGAMPQRRLRRRAPPRPPSPPRSTLGPRRPMSAPPGGRQRPRLRSSRDALAARHRQPPGRRATSGPQIAAPHRARHRRSRVLRLRRSGPWAHCAGGRSRTAHASPNAAQGLVRLAGWAHCAGCLFRASHTCPRAAPPRPRRGSEHGRRPAAAAATTGSDPTWLLAVAAHWEGDLARHRALAELAEKWPRRVPVRPQATMRQLMQYRELDQAFVLFLRRPKIPKSGLG